MLNLVFDCFVFDTLLKPNELSSFQSNHHHKNVAGVELAQLKNTIYQNFKFISIYYILNCQKD